MLSQNKEIFMTTDERIAANKSKKHSIVAWLLLAVLLFLRFPILGFGEMLWGQRDWLDPVYQVGTYFFTAALIWWERGRLADFHIDGLALAIIILFKPVQTLILCYLKMSSAPLAFQNWPSLLVWAIALGLVFLLWRDRACLPPLSKRSFAWVGIGLLVGLLEVLLMGYPMSLQVEGFRVSSFSSLGFILRRAPVEFTFQLGYAAVSEEPLFRGFLWGYLLKLGWKGVWIWLFQAALFMLGHIYYAGDLPISFWLLVPVAALVLGAMAWKSKTISSSMAAHATMNSLGYLVGSLIAGIMK
jgi:membrane protease YdiL (CAAX protease family)